MENEAVEKFNVGDKVVFIYDKGHWGRRESLRVIEGETPTRYFLDGGRPYFYKKNLRMVGERYSRIERLTPEWIEKIKRKDIESKLRLAMNKAGENRNKISKANTRSMEEAISLLDSVFLKLGI